MKKKLTFRQFQVALECVLIVLAAAALVCEWIRPGSVNGFHWICIAAMAGIRCIMLLWELERAEDSVTFWRERCRERDGDISMLCRENSELAGRLREMEACEMDDLK
ncbi:MAG: hypothetical protein IJX14_06390 [Clostridia bacterium]|nr:hypothetical protein [Clostridia bacterium]